MRSAGNHWETQKPIANYKKHTENNWNRWKELNTNKKQLDTLGYGRQLLKQIKLTQTIQD